MKIQETYFLYEGRDSQDRARSGESIHYEHERDMEWKYIGEYS